MMDFGSRIVGALVYNTPAPFAAGTGSAQTLITGVSGKKIRVLGYSCVGNGNNTNGVAPLGDGVSTLGYVAPAFPPHVVPVADCGWCETGSGLPLQITVAAGVVYAISIVYQLVPA